MAARNILLLAAAAPARAARLYAAGSGHDMFGFVETAHEVIALSGKAHPTVLYLGTATYDDPSPMKEQTRHFAAAGCSISTLAFAWEPLDAAAAAAAFAVADVILLSGGNTLFAVDRWATTGVDALLRRATARGAVVAGGSAGFIALCNGGHSDSMDPASYKNPPGPLLNASCTARPAVDAAWAYIRVPGIGLIDALCCPHYDMTGSNGVQRAVDFSTLLQHHSAEPAIGIDNFAALIVEDDRYRVVARAGQPGSVAANGSFAQNRTGVPGLWQLGVDQSGALVRTQPPAEGAVSDLFRPSRYVAAESALAVARAQNPDDGRRAAWNVTGSCAVAEGASVLY